MKRFQVFLSSTFKDLESVRRAVIENLPSLNCFASAMEYFDNVDGNKQWDVIARELALSDYYVLLIGDRYGTVEDGHTLSYTEREFDLAQKLKIPTITFAKSSALTPKDQKEKLALDAFRKKAQLVNSGPSWSSSEDLVAKVLGRLPKFIEAHPMPGWTKEEENLETCRKLLQEVAILKAALATCEGQRAEGEIDRKSKMRTIVSNRSTLPDGDHPSLYGVVVFEENTRVVARFIGESLEKFGVVNVLRKPLLQLINTAGAVIATGKRVSEFGDSERKEFALEYSSLGLFALDEARNDTVISITLSPGNYTFVCRSMDAVGGVALFELHTYVR